MQTLNILKDFIPKENILQNEPMSLHTSFRLGGEAKYFVLPSSHDEAVGVVNALKQAGEDYVVIGNGSNLLVSDKGFDGTVVCIGKNMSDITVQGNEIHAMAGALLSTIASVARSHSLAGFEFASGIPGSLGGAVVMNAGAYDGEMKNVVSILIFRFFLKKGHITPLFLFSLHHSTISSTSMGVFTMYFAPKSRR